MNTDLRNKVINTTGEQGSQTNWRANVQALEDSETEDTDGNYAWTPVVRRRRKNVVVGTRKTVSKLKGVASTHDMYVGRGQPSVSKEVLTKYIKETANVAPQACAVISKPDIFAKSFKVTVSVSELERLLDQSIWPEDIRVSKYTNGRFTANSRRYLNISLYYFL